MKIRNRKVNNKPYPQTKTNKALLGTLWMDRRKLAGKNLAHANAN